MRMRPGAIISKIRALRDTCYTKYSENESVVVSVNAGTEIEIYEICADDIYGDAELITDDGDIHISFFTCDWDLSSVIFEDE